MRVPSALGDERNLPIGIACGHAPAAKYTLDLLRGRDLTEVEKHLCAQWFRAEYLGVGCQCEGAQAAGGVQEERRGMVQLQIAKSLA